MKLFNDKIFCPTESEVDELIEELLNPVRNETERERYMHMQFHNISYPLELRCIQCRSYLYCYSSNNIRPPRYH